jgi:hypothetical protein
LQAHARGFGIINALLFVFEARLEMDAIGASATSATDDHNEFSSNTSCSSDYCWSSSP